MRRREWLTAMGTAVTAGIAGCTSSDDSEGTSSDDSEAAANGTEGTENGTDDEQDPAETGPTLEDFEFPEYASRDGLEAGDFVSAHFDRVRDEGSVTVVESATHEHPHGSNESETEARIGSEGILVTEGTIDRWTEHESNRGFVRRDHGFQSAYQITDNAVSTPRALLERDATRFANGFAFGEATSVVEIEGTVTARYDVTDVADSAVAARLTYADEITDATGSAFVTEDGLLKRFEYDIDYREEGNDERRTAEVTYGDVGATSVSEPEWVATAREDGRLLEPAVTDDGYLELTLANGEPIPEGASASISMERAYGRGPLPAEVAVGDRIVVAFTDHGVSIAVNEEPEPESAASGNYGYVSIWSDRNTIYADDFTLA